MKFELVGTEFKKYFEWDKEHKKTCNVYNSKTQAAIGGRLTFSFTPTGLGNAVTVKCVCGEEHNCTDYDSW